MPPRQRRLARPQMARVTTFSVAMPRPETHLYEITMRIAPFPSPLGRFDLVLRSGRPAPTWSGSSRGTSATSRPKAGRTPLPVVKISKNRWRVGSSTTRPPALHVRYRVYAHELTVRTRISTPRTVRQRANLFFYVDGRRTRRSASGSSRRPGGRSRSHSPGRSAFAAADYDELVDSPFECGTHRVFPFRVLGSPTRSLSGGRERGSRRLVRDLTAS